MVTFQETLGRRKLLELDLSNDPLEMLEFGSCVIEIFSDQSFVDVASRLQEALDREAAAWPELDTMDGPGQVIPTVRGMGAFLPCDYDPLPVLERLTADLTENGVEGTITVRTDENRRNAEMSLTSSRYHSTSIEGICLPPLADPSLSAETADAIWERLVDFLVELEPIIVEGYFHHWLAPGDVRVLWERRKLIGLHKWRLETFSEDGRFHIVQPMNDFLLVAAGVFTADADPEPLVAEVAEVLERLEPFTERHVIRESGDPDGFTEAPERNISLDDASGTMAEWSYPPEWGLRALAETNPMVPIRTPGPNTVLSEETHQLFAAIEHLNTLGVDDYIAEGTRLGYDVRKPVATSGLWLRPINYWVAHEHTAYEEVVLRKAIIASRPASEWPR